MRFNLKLMLLYTTVLCFLLFVFRVPLEYIWENTSVRPERVVDLLNLALNPFRHLVYIFGYEPEYVNGFSRTFGQVNIFEFFLFVAIPFALSVILHIGAVVGFICGICYLHDKAAQ